MMAQNQFQNFSMEQAMAFAASPAGQQLIKMLQKKGNADLTKAQEHAAAGNMAQAKEALASILSDPEVIELLKHFGG